MQEKIRKSIWAFSESAEGFFSSNKTFYILFILFGGISLFTIGLHPLPWFDEVFFADISNSYRETGKFYLPMAPNIYRGEILFYGPVYFFIQSWVIKLMGLDIVQFRFLNFLAGVFLVIVFRNLMLRLTKNSALANFLSLLLLVDPVFGQNIHSGRMDMVATLVAFGGVWAYFRFCETKNPLFLYLIAGLFTIAYLTTPRIVFITLPIAIVLFLEWKSIKPFHILGCLLLFSIPVLGWVLLKAGSIANYLKLFDNGNIAYHIGPKSGYFSFFRYGYYLPVYCLVLYFGFQTVYLSFQSKTVRTQSVLFALVIIMFHLLVVEKGPYSAMVLPFYFGLIGLGISQNNNQQYTKWIGLAGIGISSVLYASLFFAKNSLLIFTMEERNQNVVEKQIDLLQLKGKKVVASFEYYYLLKNAGVEYNTYETSIEMSSRLHYHIDTLKMDYLFLNRRDLISHQLNEYLTYGRFEKVDEVSVESKVPKNTMVKAINSKANFYIPTFSGILYRRLEKD